MTPREHTPLRVGPHAILILFLFLSTQPKFDQFLQELRRLWVVGSHIGQAALDVPALVALLGVRVQIK